MSNNMKIRVKISEKDYIKKTTKGIEKIAREVIVYGVNQVRNTAIESIARGTKTGKPRADGSRASASGEAPATDTGFLQSNIVVKRDPDGLGGDVESRADYSAPLEFGTKNMGARPFMQPSLEENRPKIRRRLKAVFG